MQQKSKRYRFRREQVPYGTSWLCFLNATLPGYCIPCSCGSMQVNVPLRHLRNTLAAATGSMVDPVVPQCAAAVSVVGATTAMSETAIETETKTKTKAECFARLRREVDAEIKTLLAEQREEKRRKVDELVEVLRLAHFNASGVR